MPDEIQNIGPSPIPFTAPTPTIIPNPQQNTSAITPFSNSGPGQPAAPSSAPKSTKKTLIFVFMGLLFLIILAAVIFFVYPKFIKPKVDEPTAQANPEASTIPLPTNSPQNSVLASPKTASDPNFANSEFTIAGPINWTKLTGTQNAIVQFQNTIADSSTNGQTYAAQINVNSEPLSKIMTLDEYAVGTNTQRTTTLTGYKLISQTKGPLGGQTANIDVYTIKIGSIDVKQGQIYVIRNQKAYTLTFAALPETWDNYAQIFNSSAQSFKFVGI